MNTEKTAILYRMVMDKHICPYGIKSKYLLKRQGFKVEDHHLTSRYETDQFKEKHDVKTTPQTFIDGERVGGYDALKERFDTKDKPEWLEKYQPIIALFSVTFLMAIALIARPLEAMNGFYLIPLFVAISMCVLAVLKLRDLESFSTMFITYDLLGRRFVPYAYIYPFAEAIAGIGMLGYIATPLAALIALFIGGVGAVSVAKAVYIDKRDLKCACVGGNSDVPLGAISLTENVMMVLMGAWMLV